MKILAIIIGKLIRSLMKLTGGGSSLPGKIARQLCPNLLKKMNWPDQIIFVTGTNGKTSTTYYLAQIFEQSGKKVMTNAEGANLIQGITTIALKHSDLKGTVQADIAILEVDEGALPTIWEHIPPSHLVITNLFPDQIDRFGSPDDVMQLISNSITAGTKLILNGNDPRLAQIGRLHPENTVIYYGVAPDSFHQPTQPINCPECGEALTYTCPLYEQIGYYYCEHCHLETPAIFYLAEEAKIDEQTFKIKDTYFQMPQNNIYTLFNALAAIATADSMHADTAIIQRTLAKPLHIKGRNDQLQLDGKKIPISLAKNPASMNQTILSMLRDAQTPFNLMMSVNNAPADGVDTSWLQFVDFNLLRQKGAAAIYLSGSAAEAVRQQLLAAKIPEEIIITGSHKDGLQHLKKSPTKSFIIANYTALYEIYDEIK